MSSIREGVIAAASREAERREIMAFQGVNTIVGGRIASNNKPNYHRIDPAHDVATDGFIIWWNKTLAQHAAMVAQASALIRVHRRVNSVDEACIGQTS